jgi:hypothetical protein
LKWAFRNRIRVHSKDGKTGFYAKSAHQIVDIRECAIASAEVNAALAQFRKHPHPPEQMTLSAKQGVRFFEQTNDAAAEVLACLVESLVGDGRGTLVDAYAGAGFFGHRLAPRFHTASELKRMSARLQQPGSGLTRTRPTFAAMSQIVWATFCRRRIAPKRPFCWIRRPLACPLV